MSHGCCLFCFSTYCYTDVCFMCIHLHTWRYWCCYYFLCCLRGKTTLTSSVHSYTYTDRPKTTGSSRVIQLYIVLKKHTEFSLKWVSSNVADCSVDLDFDHQIILAQAMDALLVLNLDNIVKGRVLGLWPHWSALPVCFEHTHKFGTRVQELNQILDQCFSLN